MTTPRSPAARYARIAASPRTAPASFTEVNHRMPTLRSPDGTMIVYDRLGRGPPVILVDGALCCRTLGPMMPIARQLAASYTVVTYDRRGRGEK